MKMFKRNIQMISSIESHDIKKLSYVRLRSTAEDLLQSFNYSHRHMDEIATRTLHAFSSGCRNEVLKNLMDFSKEVLSQSVGLSKEGVLGKVPWY